MKFEEAIVYLLANFWPRDADRVVRPRDQRSWPLYPRGQDAGDKKQVYTVIISYPDTFVKAEGLIRLMI